LDDLLDLGIHPKTLLQRDVERKDEEILDFYQKILLHQVEGGSGR
jgi:hypothetical protein